MTQDSNFLLPFRDRVNFLGWCPAQRDAKPGRESDLLDRGPVRENKRKILIMAYCSLEPLHLCVQRVPENMDGVPCTWYTNLETNDTVGVAYSTGPTQPAGKRRPSLSPLFPAQGSRWLLRKSYFQLSSTSGQRKKQPRACNRFGILWWPKFPSRDAAPSALRSDAGGVSPRAK